MSVMKNRFENGYEVLLDCISLCNDISMIKGIIEEKVSSKVTPLVFAVQQSEKLRQKVPDDLYMAYQSLSVLFINGVNAPDVNELDILLFTYRDFYRSLEANNFIIRNDNEKQNYVKKLNQCLFSIALFTYSAFEFDNDDSMQLAVYTFIKTKGHSPAEFLLEKIRESGISIMPYHSIHPMFVDLNSQFPEIMSAVSDNGYKLSQQEAEDLLCGLLKPDTLLNKIEKSGEYVGDEEVVTHKELTRLEFGKDANKQG